MAETKLTEDRPAEGAVPARCVLNAGSGGRASRQLHPVFRRPNWTEVRLDIDPREQPDHVGSFTDMSDSFASASFDAVWSSHAVEHLHAHEVPSALAEFRRILKDDGFVLIRCPDIEIAAELLIQHGPDHIVYVSSLGPITPLDMLFGHAASIAQGRIHMAHRTGFTCSSLAKLLLDAGFATVIAKREYFDLWVLALMQDANAANIQRELADAGLDLNDTEDDVP
ncbi:MAG: class I SAM-dependent methyltransferase [Methylacidiphilales bacterium]|nr:class I SAM-dependent methyltransferase [Candidatus Methylacidiphilales bacterium]